MKKMLSVWGVLGILAAVQASAESAPSAPVFADVAQHLETGGNFYMVATFDGAMERMSQRIVDFMQVAAAGNADAADTRKTVGIVLGHLKRSGLFDFSGVGVSTVPRSDGDFDFRMFLRALGSTEKPLLKAFFGAQPGTLDALRFLPADTVFASVGTGDSALLWTFVRDTILAVMENDAKQAFNEKIKSPNPFFGMGMDEMLRGLGGQGAFALTLSESTKCAIPAAGGPVEIPAPALLCAMQLRDQSVGEKLLALQSMGGIPVQQSVRNAVQMRSVPIPAPLPFPFQLSFAVVDGYLLLATTPDTLARALEAGAGKAGLAATPAFKDAFAGLPLSACSGLSYSSRRFGVELQEFQLRMAKQTSGTSAEDQQSLRRLVATGRPAYSATVSINTGAGLLQRGVTSTGGGEVMAGLAAAPVGMLAAIAIPSFVKARNTSSGNSCINNLRQLDAAKEQWALMKGAQDGADIVLEEVLEFIKGARLPVCPAGGTYRVGRIGEDPICSHPGHAL